MDKEVDTAVIKKQNKSQGIPPEPGNRPSWDSYFMEICRIVAKRSTCLRRKVGAVIVKDRRILTTGYNGVPSGIMHCQEYGCIRAKLQIPAGERHELCRGLHGEQNAIIQAALHGINISNSTLYCTTKPCIVCIKMCINAGINKIVFKEGYPDALADEMAEEAGIKMIPFDNDYRLKAKG